MNFSSLLVSAPDIHRFIAEHVVKTHCLLENLGIPGPSLSVLEKFECKSAVPDIKYDIKYKSAQKEYEFLELPAL